MTTKNLQILRDDINAALLELAVKHGLEIHAGDCTFTDKDCSFKLKVFTENKEQRLATKKATQLAHLKSFCPELVDKKICLKQRKRGGIQSKTFDVVGFNISASKNCIMIKCIDDGKTYACETPVALANIVEPS